MEYSNSAPIDANQIFDDLTLVRCNSDPNLTNLGLQLDRVLSQSMSSSSSQGSETYDGAQNQVWIMKGPTQFSQPPQHLSPIHDPFFTQSQASSLSEKPLKKYLREMLNEGPSIESSQTGFGSSSRSSEWIPDDVDQHWQSVRSEDVPLSQVTVFEEEFEKPLSSFPQPVEDFHESDKENQNNNKSVQDDDGSQSPHNVTLGPDVSFKFNKTLSQDEMEVKDDLNGTEDDTVIIFTQDQAKDEIDPKEKVSGPLNLDTTNDTVILFTQDDEGQQPSESLNTDSLQTDDFPFIPLTFTTSFDLKNKLRTRNLIPPTQTQNFPTPGGDHRVPTSAISLPTIDTSNCDFAVKDDKMKTKIAKKENGVKRKKPEKEILYKDSTFTSENSFFCSQNSQTSMENSLKRDHSEKSSVEPSLKRDLSENEMFYLSGGYGLTNVSIPKLLNRAPRVGLSRLEQVKPLHKQFHQK